MPNQRYRKRRGRRNYSSKSGGYLNTASKALAVAYAVKKLVNVEYFNVNTDFTGDPSSSGAVVNLTAIPQGDELGHRQGNKVRAKYISMGGNVNLHASATNTIMRIALIRDNNGSTTQPAITDNWSTVLDFAQNQPKRGAPQQCSRFSVLYDRAFVISTENPRIAFSWSSSLDHHIYFTGTTATDEGKGHIYLFIASDQATNDPVVQASSSVRYIDN